MVKRLFFSLVFLLQTLLLAAAGRDELLVDSLNKAALRAYDTSYPSALLTLQHSADISQRLGYLHGELEATCLRSVIWSNTNRCVEALDDLRRLSSQTEASQSPLLYLATAECWFIHGNYDSARFFNEKAIRSLRSGKPSAAYYHACLQLARTYIKNGLTDEALGYYDTANRFFVSVVDSSGIAMAERVAGEIFYSQHLYEKAATHLLASQSYFRRRNNYRVEASLLLQLGNIYYMRTIDDSARQYYNAALDRCVSLGDSAGIAICYSNLSRIMLEAGNTTRAIAYAQKALATIRPGNYITLEAGTYQHLGDIYGELKKYDAAVGCVQRALAAARRGDNKVIVRDCYKSLSELYSMMQKPADALTFLLAAYRLKDSIEPAQFSRRLAEMDARYKAEKKEAEIRSLKQQTLISSLKMQQQRTKLQVAGYLLLFLVALLVSAGIAVYYRNMRRNLLEQLQREKMVKDTEERERMRIARDIHDELGSGLSKIRFLADNAGAMPTAENGKSVQQISETSRGLIDNMRDLVWAMNPENTTLDSLIARIREHAVDYLEHYPVDVELDFPEFVPSTSISKELTRNVFMIVREVLQNIVKHSGAGKVWMWVNFDGALRLEIRDNGRGFDVNTARNGNGLGNLAARSKAINATLHVSSAPGSGTAITLVLQPDAATPVS